MIDFVQLQGIVKEHLEHDRAIKTIDASGPTLETAVGEAASLLDVSIRLLEYEVVERGSSGFLGVAKKDWTIRAYQRERTRKGEQVEELLFDDMTEAAPIIEDKDGDAFVQFWQDGVYLKVTPPVGEGKRVHLAYVMHILHSRAAANTDSHMIEKMIDAADGMYIKVGEFEHHADRDSVATVEVADSEMRVFLQVTPAEEGGCDLTLEDYHSLLKQNRVYHGVKEEFLKDFADRPVYREKIEVAEGTRAINGKDAYMQYNFETDQTKIRLREGTNGRVNFKELNIIQNVTQNDLLARKMPPEQGIDGKTVIGKLIPAKDGSDIPLPLGNNVRAGDDDDTILAEINGQVMFVGGKVNVEPVYTVEGDVNLKTGNIVFLGTVVVNGNVEDGFSIKAAGNIEVKGIVEKAELDAEGDIIIYQGANSKGGGKVRAGKSLWARFIENANIDSGSMVVVSDGIINSRVDALKSIVCQGKRASIVGGCLRAGEEINAKVLGNANGTETICEVGFDPQSKIELERLVSIRQSAEKELDDIKMDLQNLINTKKQRKSLPEDKEAYLQELMDKRQLLTLEKKKAEEEIQKIQEYLNDIKIRGRVSASTKVYPGVRIMIRDVREDVHSEHRGVTFVLENGLVRAAKYEEPDELAKKGLDGYSSD
jgi:uncharacterized protein (DUF342 family)